MRISRITTWKREGALGALALHIAIFFVFVLIVSFVSVSIEETFVAWISEAHAAQIIAVLLMSLTIYIGIEAGLLGALTKPYRSTVLAEPWAQREWIAYTMIGGTLIATLTSPLTFGSFALILPGLPELIVFIVFPYLVGSRDTKAIKADEHAG